MEKLKETGDSGYIFMKNELEKACFQHDMVYEALKDLPRKNASDKALCQKAFNILIIQIMIDINTDLLQKKYTNFLATIFWVLILQICNLLFINIIKYFVFYYVSSIFLVKMHGLFL